MVGFAMKSIEVPEIDQIELKKWDTLLETSPRLFHIFDWDEHIEIDYDTYLTYTNCILPISLLNVEKDWRVLDIGCRWGRDLNILRKGYGANAIGIDLQKYNNDMILSDAMFLCFKDNSFDAIISIVTFPYIQEEEKFLKEIKRILKPNGKILLVIFNNSILNLHFNLKHNIINKKYEKFHNSKEIRSTLESLNFEVEVIYFANFIFPILNRLPQFYKIIFKYENRLSKMRIAKWIAKRIVIIAKSE